MKARSPDFRKRDAAEFVRHADGLGIRRSKQAHHPCAVVADVGLNVLNGVRLQAPALLVIGVHYKFTRDGLRELALDDDIFGQRVQAHCVTTLKFFATPCALEWHLCLTLSQPDGFSIGRFIQTQHATPVSREECLQEAHVLSRQTPCAGIFESLDFVERYRLFETPFKQYELHVFLPSVALSYRRPSAHTRPQTSDSQAAMLVDDARPVCDPHC